MPKTPHIVYDGPSLPMITAGKEIFRIQQLKNGQWQSIESEEEVIAIIDLLQGCEYA